MNLVTAFLRLIRWPNLVFIVLTQVMFEYCIIQPIFQQAGVQNNIHGIYFLLLAFSYVLIAAGGYIINDYFDLNIDQINKPDKLVVGAIISRRWVIIWHLLLSAVAVIIGFYIDFSTNAYFVGVINLFCVILLFFYSVSLKKKFLIGNLLVSFITAWSITVLLWCENNHLLTSSVNHSYLDGEKLLRLTFLYSGFAFIISVIREVIKDMEDIDGDRRYGCKTMPIVWGLNATKIFVAVWLVVLIGALIVLQFYVLHFRWWTSMVYYVLFIIIPLIWVFKKLFSAINTKDFHQLSSAVKMIMMAGILSMLLFKFSI
ncbi:MAG: geranylgeranylglycerol-phosphate geranylgeranyltransferase [Bacteroidota bacterium]|nr:geranylgeranylglycerol-phosphate geranylgeranyltransferase [Bacteroidota bacterium]